MRVFISSGEFNPRVLRRFSSSSNDGGNKNNWLTVEAKLANGKTDAIGSRVTVKIPSLEQIQDIIPVTGYLSQSDHRRHFGLGKATQADVEIRWPNGDITKLKDVKANRFLSVTQKATREKNTK